MLTSHVSLDGICILEIGYFYSLWKNHVKFFSVHPMSGYEIPFSRDSLWLPFSSKNKNHFLGVRGLCTLEIGISPPQGGNLQGDVIVIVVLVLIITTTSIVIVPIILIHPHPSILIHIISTTFDLPSSMSHSHTPSSNFIQFPTSTIQFNGRILFCHPCPFIPLNLTYHQYWYLWINLKYPWMTNFSTPISPSNGLSLDPQCLWHWLQVKPGGVDGGRSWSDVCQVDSWRKPCRDDVRSWR